MRTQALALAALVAAATIVAASPLVAAAAATATPGTPDASIDHDGDRLTLTAGPGVAIAGHADLPPGERVTVRVQSTSTPGDPFVRTRTATVDRSGRFRAVFDFSGVPANATARVTVTHAGDELAAVDAAFAECVEYCGSTRTTRSASGVSGDELALENDVTGTAGSAVTFTVGFGDADAAVVSIGSERVGYRLNATVRDGNGDGRVTLAFNTSAVGDQPSLAAASDGDSVSVLEETDLPDRATALEPGTYPVALYPRADATGEPVDATTITLRHGDTSERSGVNETERAPTVGFGSIGPDAHAGSTATITLLTREGSTATLVIEGDHGYAATVAVRDGNGDGRVVVRLNTTVGANATAFATVNALDRVAVREMTVPPSNVENGTLTPGTYDLTFYGNDSVDPGPDDLGVLVLRPPEPDATTTPGADSRSGVPVAAAALVVGGLLAAGGVGVLVNARR